MKGWIFKLEHFPGDAIGSAEVLIEADTLEDARLYVAGELDGWMQAHHYTKIQRKAVTICDAMPFNGRSYINQGSNY